MKVYPGTSHRAVSGLCVKIASNVSTTSIKYLHWVKMK